MRTNYPAERMMLAQAAVHGELTADEREIVLIATGPDHLIAQAARLLQTATPLVKPTQPSGGLKLPATWAAAVQLTAMFGHAWKPGPRLRAWAKREVDARSPRSHELAYTPPPGLEPRPYQADAARMLAATGRMLIFDEPGTGKTITTILGLVEREHMGDQVRPVLCVVPASVMDAWVQAWQAWCPDWHTVAWHGTGRHELAGTADVYVTTYGTAVRDAADTKGPLVKLEAQAVVSDEVHMIKSPRAKRSLAVRRLAKRAKAFVGLSGTPITHHPGDLWPTLEALEPLAWPSRERWTERYCQTVPDDYDETVIGLAPHTETELRTALLGQHRRVAKADVLDQLPPKVYSVRRVELPPAYRKVYDDMAAKMLAQMPDGQHLSALSVLAQLTRLAQLSSAAADLEVVTKIDEDGLEREHVHVHLREPSWKVDALLEVCGERPGSPVVAFAPSRQLMMLAGAAAAREGLSVGYVVGGQSLGERTATVEHFQAGKLDLLCVTTQAGGVGLTLTAARTAVFLQRPWSLVDAVQAEDRLHRIGSERHDSIEIIDIVAKATIDTKVRSVLREKAGQLADLVQDPRIVTELLGGSNA